MNEKERIYNEIENLITTNTSEGVIGNYKEYSQVVGESAIGRQSITYNGFRYSFDKKSGNLFAENICYVILTVKNKRNRPEVILEFPEKVSSVRVGEKTYYRAENGTLRLKAVASMLESELPDVYVTINGTEEEIDAANVVYSNNSIVSYYSYYDGRKTNRFIKLTPQNVSKWWDYDCPDLKKHMINRTGNCNDFGIRLMLWENSLVEIGYLQAYIDEEMTVEELEALTSGREQTRYGSMIRKEYRHHHTSYSEAEKAEIIRSIDSKVKAIKCLVQDNSDVIAEKIYADMSGPTGITSVEDKKAWIIANEGKCGLDCGFCYYSFADKELQEKTRLSAEFGLESVCRSGELFLNTDIGGHIQSTTIQAMEARAIVQLVKENGLSEITFRTVLD